MKSKDMMVLDVTNGLDIEIKSPIERANCYSSSICFKKMVLTISIGNMINFGFGNNNATILKESDLYKKILPILRDKKYLKALKLTKQYIVKLISSKDLQKICNSFYNDGKRHGYNEHVKKTKELFEMR